MTEEGRSREGYCANWSDGCLDLSEPSGDSAEILVEMKVMDWDVHFATQVVCSQPAHAVPGAHSFAVVKALGSDASAHDSVVGARLHFQLLHGVCDEDSREGWAL